MYGIASVHTLMGIACMRNVPATERFPALHQDGLGCVGHWQLIHHQDQTVHMRNQVAPETKPIKLNMLYPFLDKQTS